MDLVHALSKVMLATGATWVLWLLIALSVVSIGIILERAYVFSNLRTDLGSLSEALSIHLESGDVDAAIKRLQTTPGVEARIALEGLKAYHKGADSVAESMASAKAVQRSLMEDHLAFLGTLGNNAPFIGLLGTVVGIIKAFRDLSVESSGAAKTVMSGISEALVATAAGLFVAIPAVIAFNYFQRRIRAKLSASDGLMHMILAELRRTPGSSATKPSAAS